MIRDPLLRQLLGERAIPNFGQFREALAGNVPLAVFRRHFQRLDERFQREYRVELGVDVKEQIWRVYTAEQQIERYARNMKFW